MTNLTPMMQQYQEAKAACPGALLLFRMGDFYEMFHDDAKTAAQVLNLALTSREKGEKAIPMAGFPHQALENYLGKLIAAGHRVAVAEQVEDPKLAKGLVKREVTRVVSPGTLTDDALLDPHESNYLAAVVLGEPTGLAWVELSTGRFLAAEIEQARLLDELARIDPVECLLSEDAELPLNRRNQRLMLTTRPAWAFGLANAKDTLKKHFGTKTLEGFGLNESGPAVAAAGAILDYLRETQKTDLHHIDRLLRYGADTTLQIDEATRRSLELVRTMREGKRQGSLVGVLDQTVTAMGSRLLAEWLANPLTDLKAINARLDTVGELVAAPSLIDELSELLRGVYDIERLVARVITGRASPRDLSFLGRTLHSLPKVKAKISARKSDLLQRLESQLDLCGELQTMLGAALEDDCPLVSHDGGFIRPGYHAGLEELRDLAAGGKQWIAQYQATEAQRSGIPSLKVGFNKVFGYYIEITHTHGSKAPDHYIRKQTVKNAERYITPELKEYEEKVLTAVEKTKELEYELFVELRAAVEGASRRLQASAKVLAELDVLCSLANLARKRGYCRPEMLEEPVLEVEEGRHPVLDIMEPDGTFVPNDVSASPESGQILLITGPNMAGKSTYIRQVALLTIMAQMGSWVPAKRARIGLADAVFARVGASDELSRGQSTFMVEMTETARILHQATRRSLVILDEIGRGTSTYDGLSLAWAVVEYLHDHEACRTLFATHYHELTQLSDLLAGVKNLNVSVREWADEVVFLHKIVPGAADKSYGIHVARLAGVPREVIERAKDILSELESHHLDSSGHSPLARPRDRKKQSHIQLTLFGPTEHPLLDHLRDLDLNQLTPFDALIKLQSIQQELRSTAKRKH